MTHLIPPIEGLEITEMDLHKLHFTAFTGTGFNGENKWHSGWGLDGQGPFPLGGDALRYAIAIQQWRDLGNYGASDAARELVKGFGYDVGHSVDRTIVSGFKIQST